MMLLVILLSILMIVLSALNVIRHLTCGNSHNWLLNLNLIYETMWTGARSGLLISVLEKIILFCLTDLILQKKLSFKMLGLTVSSKLEWGPYIISVA